jgi:hypothetical protein
LHDSRSISRKQPGKSLCLRTHRTGQQSHTDRERERETILFDGKICEKIETKIRIRETQRAGNAEEIERLRNKVAESIWGVVARWWTGFVAGFNAALVLILILVLLLIIIILSIPIIILIGDKVKVPISMILVTTSHL